MMTVAVKLAESPGSMLPLVGPWIVIPVGGGVLELPHPIKFVVRDRPRSTRTAVNRRAVRLELRMMEFTAGEQVRKTGLGKWKNVGLVYARRNGRK